MYRWWRVAGISIIGLLITLAIVFTVVYAMETVEQKNTITKTYGKTVQNEINFNKTNITEHEIDDIAFAFQTIGFFDSSFPKFVSVVKNGTTYEISISAPEDIENDSESILIYTGYRDQMDSLLPNNKIEFKLVVNYLDNVVKVLK